MRGCEEETCQKILGALDKWYWSRNGDTNKQDRLKPVQDVIEYVKIAKSIGLDKQSEAGYCGTILLHSVLFLTGRRFTSDVNEANELYDAGKSLASLIWDESGGLEENNGLDFIKILWERSRSL